MTGSLHHAPTRYRGRPQSVDAELEIVDRNPLVGRVDEPRGELDVHRLLREEPVGDGAERLPHPVGVGEAGADERREPGARARSRPTQLSSADQSGVSIGERVPPSRSYHSSS